ncbi:rod shape-determining protein MreD [Anianabacter salinae]|uniref:rod shape-determining protein MreD n=1 Tax=Anianabacter salinae TaxID=2851023 RepID=UPI00225E639A|nr:rod shape-determining protein MreD [Anianabacter salinae]MBV0910979.1 rod shape-determining protein MreD [Anianabacter salinae]
MVDPRTLRRIGYAALYVAICLGLMIYNILPIDLQAGTIPGPDLMLCVTFAWVLRRPRWVPVLLIAAMFLVADLMFMRPPGLWAALVVLASEYLRNHDNGGGELTFGNEMLMVAATILTISLADRLVLSLLLVDQVPVRLTLLQFLTTIVAYPVVVLISHLGLGVRKMSPTEDALEARL